MSRWTGLDRLLAGGRLRRAVEHAPADLPLRERAAWISWSLTYGTTDQDEIAARVAADPDAKDHAVSGINVAALALQSRCAPQVWIMRPSASAVVHATDLHSIPDEPPELLRTPGVVEVRRPERGETLWADYASLGWYDVDGATYLLGLRYPDGYAVARWTPRWTGGEIDPELPQDDRSPLIDDVEQHREFARQAARYLIVLGLLAESDPSPLRIELDRRERKRRDVYLGERGPREADPSATPEPSTDQADQADQRIAEAVAVRGHLKRQRFGEGRAQVKWIYVAGYSARRWFAPRWLVERREEPS